MKLNTISLQLRLPPDARAFLVAQAQRNGSSMNSEIIRSIRDRMEKMAATGEVFGDPAPAAAANHQRAGGA